MNIFENMPLYFLGEITFDELVFSIEDKITKAIKQILEEENNVN